MAEAQKAQSVTVETSEAPTPVRSRPLNYFEETERDMQRLFDAVMGRIRPFGIDFFGRREALDLRAPSIDLIDQDDSLLLRAELSGVDKKDLELSVNHDTVSIRASSRSEKKAEEADYYYRHYYYRHQISSSHASRTVALPCGVDGKRASAQLKDGVLELTLPKVEKSTRQRIEVK